MQHDLCFCGGLNFPWYGGPHESVSHGGALGMALATGSAQGTYFMCLAHWLVCLVPGLADPIGTTTKGTRRKNPSIGTMAAGTLPGPLSDP